MSSVFDRGIYLLKNLGPRGLVRKCHSIWKEQGLKGLLTRLAKSQSSSPLGVSNSDWLVRFSPTVEQLSAMKLEQETWSYRPRFSVIVPIYNVPELYLRAALDSVLDQVYPEWELCIADDCSPSPHIREVLNEYAARDQRIKVTYRETNGHISHCSNSALDLAGGDFVALLDHDDTLAPHALFSFAKVLNSDPDIDVLYSDEDKIDTAGRRFEPAFKAAWSPDYFLSFMYSGHLAAYRRALIEESGRFRPGFEGTQDYDLMLRVSERARKVVHVPEILYHWRTVPGSTAGDLLAKPYAFDNAKRSLTETLVRRGIEGATVTESPRRGIFRVHYALKGQPKVLMLAARPKVGISESQIQTLTKYPALEFHEARQGEHTVTFWRDSCLDAPSEYVMFTDSRIQPRDANWLERLVAMMQGTGAAMISCRIDSKSDTVLYGGAAMFDARLSNNFWGRSVDDFGYCARLYTPHNVSFPSAHCMLVRSDLLFASRVFESGYELPESFTAHLALWCSVNNKRIIFQPLISCVWRGENFPQTIDLSQSAGDISSLSQKFAIHSFRDPYYPSNLRQDGSFLEA